jgi:hypothetical protein
VWVGCLPPGGGFGFGLWAILWMKSANLLWKTKGAWVKGWWCGVGCMG